MRRILLSLFVTGTIFFLICTTAGYFPKTQDEVAYEKSSGSFVSWLGLLRQGVRQKDFFRAFRREHIKQYWDVDGEHPSLFKIISGMSQALLGGVLGSLGALRAATAVCFSFFSGMFFFMLAKKHGYLFSFLALILLIGTPRFFGYLHLAEITIHLTWLWNLILLIVWRCLREDKRGGGYIVSGALWGLAVAAKITSVLLFVICAAYVSVTRRRDVRRFAGTWIFFGFCAFLLSWPTLWFEGLGCFISHVERFRLANSLTETMYFFRPYAELPRHYPWVMFFATMPVYLVPFLLLGTFRVLKDRDPLGILGILNFLFVMFGLSLYTGYPGDGVRHFLVIYPLVAYIIAYGVCKGLEPRSAEDKDTLQTPGRRKAGIFIACMVAFILVFENIIVFPNNFKYYSILIGGTSGAVKMGLEEQYYK